MSKQRGCDRNRLLKAEAEYPFVSGWSLAGNYLAGRRNISIRNFYLRVFARRHHLNC